MECLTVLDCDKSVNLRRVIKYRKLKLNTFETFLYYFQICVSLLLFVPSGASDLDWPSHLTYETIFNSTTYAQIENNKLHPTQKYNYEYIKPHLDTFLPSSEYNDLNDSPDNYIYEDYVLDNSYKGGSRDETWLVGYSHDPYRLSISGKDYERGVSYKNPPPMKDVRGKRGVMHLYNMIWCSTGCEPLMYKGYGCYCGFLGSGRPTDGIDRCCKMHDECYENIYCPFFTVYFQPYYWKCYHGEPLCARENKATSHQLINGCAARLCECDRKLAMCLRQYSCPRRRSFCRSSPLRFLQNILTLHVA